MDSVNAATQGTLEQFRKKAAELPWESHPYATAVQSREKLGATEWNDEHRREAIGAMVMWTTMIVGKSIVTTLNEMVALMQIAAAGDDEHKKAADEMASSMNFVENVFRTFMASIDFDHVATQLFADGERMEKERAAEFAAAEAAKAKVTKAKQPLTGTVHRRWEPSQN